MNESVINQTSSPLFLKVPKWDVYSTEQYAHAEIITISRQQPTTWRSMLQSVSLQTFRIHGKLHANRLNQDVYKLLKQLTPVRNIECFQEWQQDITDIAKHFCRTMQIDYTWLSLTSERVCSKFHVDKTDMRLLVTYCGQGTQWVDTRELKPTIQTIPTHHIALFKGNAEHLHHRSPTIQYPSILLRLDTPHFKMQYQQSKHT